jgi:hypothetical protein
MAHLLSNNCNVRDLFALSLWADSKCKGFLRSADSFGADAHLIQIDNCLIVPLFWSNDYKL